MALTTARLRVPAKVNNCLEEIAKLLENVSSLSLYRALLQLLMFYLTRDPRQMETAREARKGRHLKKAQERKSKMLFMMRRVINLQSLPLNKAAKTTRLLAHLGKILTGI